MAYGAKTQPESEVVSAVCEYLALRNYFFWRQNNAGIYDVTQRRFRSMPLWSMKGVSDVILLNDGTIHFIECKSSKGSQSQEQKAFQRAVEENGGRYYIVKNLDDLRDFGF